jgi:DNA polymerase family B
MWPDKECTGCGALFAPKVRQQKRCKPDCKARTSEKKNKMRTVTRTLHEVEFIAVDGEGLSRPLFYMDYDEETGEEIERRAVDDDRHDYVLLSVGDQSYHRNGKSLDHDGIFRFLYDQFLEHPDAAFVGFALGYDFTMWLRSLDEYSAHSLLTKEGIRLRQPREDSGMVGPFPVRDGGRRYNDEGYVFKTAKWEFDILGSKRFKLRPFVKPENMIYKVVNHRDGTSSTKKMHPYKWMYICDVFPFFQSSFLKAIKPQKGATPIVSQEEYDVIVEGKQHRSCGKRCLLGTPDNCPGDFGDAMIRYNLLENEILARLMSTLNEGFVADEIRLTKKQWMGPGQAAQEWMRLIGVPTREETEEAVPRWAFDAARKSYYGGWFEIFNHGPVPGTSYAYDINSAYPAVIATLPCLLHGEWRQGSRANGDRLLKLRSGDYRLVYGTFSGTDDWVGPLPHRTDDGNISHPRVTKGWYWWHEVQAAKKAKLLTRMEIEEWIEYAPCDCPPPMATVRELYNGRLYVGKNTPQGKAKKLVYNSAYGKCAQSIGQPRFSNSVYASLITAGCRTQILEAIATHPTKSASLLMIATDGIVFKEPHPNLDIDPERLGAWDEETYENLSLFMPGLYWHDEARKQIAEGQAPQLKSRGVSAKYLGNVIDRVDRLWREYEGGKDMPRVSLTIDWALIGAKQAIVRNAWETCGKNIYKAKRVLDGSPYNKRLGLTKSDASWGGIRSWPYDTRDNLETLPYEPRFGLQDEELEADDVDELITPDGRLGDINAHAFGLR